jgi:hypothetical protein
MRFSPCLPPLLFVAVLAATRGARADDGGDKPQPPSPRWAVGFNPLALAIGRFSADLERLVAPHAVLVVNVHGDFASHDLPALEYDRPSPVWGFGGEAGWRWVAAEQAMHGFFLCASLVYGWYNVEYNGQRLGLPGAGLAVDMGAQWELGHQVFLAVGGGLQYLWTKSYPADIAPGVSFVMGAGFDPRLLLTLGVLLP